MMSESLKMLCLTLLFALSSNSQDTLWIRGGGYFIMPKYDSVQELKQINAKADTILNDLLLIKLKLGIKDTIQ